MPKILVKPKETIKKAGKQLLTRRNSGQFTITELSEKSRISRRTFYLRFGSKGALVKDVVLEDWAKDKKKLKKATVSGSSLQERAHLLYTRLRDFGDRYSSSFPDIFAGGGLLRTSEDIAGELSDISGLSRFVVEVILTFVPLPEVTYEQIEPQLRKLLSEDRGTVLPSSDKTKEPSLCLPTLCLH
ncbi:MAG: TetR/AcrR family transcriptional regulator [Eubacteriales bacterium]|nr:TetR/AcrR family transcriptional regulator [Eubacteriales bacterium]